jgi:hypothetical protein
MGQVSAESNKKLFSKYSVSSSAAILAFPVNSSDPIVFSGNPLKGKNAVTTFINQHALPRDPSELGLPRLLDQSCLNQHCLDTNAPLCVVGFTHGSCDYNKLEILDEVSKSMSSNIYKFSWIDATANSNFTSSFGFDNVTEMKVVVWSPRKNRFGVFPGEVTKKVRVFCHWNDDMLTLFRLSRII